MKNTLAWFAAAVAPLWAPVASAGVITLDVSVTMTPTAAPDNPAACTPTCTLPATS
jgi:hypothetical protein